MSKKQFRGKAKGWYRLKTTIGKENYAFNNKRQYGRQVIINRRHAPLKGLSGKISISTKKKGLQGKL